MGRAELKFRGGGLCRWGETSGPPGTSGSSPACGRLRLAQHGALIVPLLRIHTGLGGTILRRRLAAPKGRSGRPARLILVLVEPLIATAAERPDLFRRGSEDRKSTRLNSSH